jgi:hypothetical protein
VADMGKSLGLSKAFAEWWFVFGALGSFLYLFGYLSLRFHLTTFGIVTELSVLNEQYLFAGARFLVYLVTLVPTVTLLTLLVFTIFWLSYRILPSATRERIRAFCASRWETLCLQRSDRLALAGVVLSVVLIQLFMRQCFFFENLLLKPTLPGPPWLQSILLNGDNGLQVLFFSGIVVGTVISGGLLLLAVRNGDQTVWSRLMVGLLAFLVATEFLLLPVNHGVLVAEKTVPKIASVDGLDTSAGEQIWLIWAEKESVTFLVQYKAGTGKSRTIVTLPRGKVGRIQIAQFDPILKILFGQPRAR